MFEMGQNNSGYDMNTTPQANNSRRMNHTPHQVGEGFGGGYAKSALTPSQTNYGGGYDYNRGNSYSH